MVFASLCEHNSEELTGHISSLPSNTSEKTRNNRNVYSDSCMYSISDWFTLLFTSVVIGESNYFGLGFKILKTALS